MAAPAPAVAPVAPVPVGQLLQGLADATTDAAGGTALRDSAAAPGDALASPEVPDSLADEQGSAFRKPVIHAKGLEGPSGGRLHYSAPGEGGGTEERDVVAPGSGAAAAATRPPVRRTSKKARRRGK